MAYICEAPWNLKFFEVIYQFENVWKLNDACVFARPTSNEEIYK